MNKYLNMFKLFGSVGRNAYICKWKWGRGARYARTPWLLKGGGFTVLYRDIKTFIQKTLILTLCQLIYFALNNKEIKTTK